MRAWYNLNFDAGPIGIAAGCGSARGGHGPRAAGTRSQCRGLQQRQCLHGVIPFDSLAFRLSSSRPAAAAVAVLTDLSLITGVVEALVKLHAGLDSIALCLLQRQR